ncbi:glycosyltransferase family 2 protein [Geminocystis sp. GBBB08]|uniref:glycosyltransferase family 2 protein n=1 Tax=Geminocystis sp. GBBB08 TaxID=2604140 RepID=UPI0027E21A2E|nr:glycosyltransferase family 2 protein [Geminocystis sp. GBBB08]MBL1209355.1 glycosyltransferase family 2 protein [Geminocystis sp. GBBB08]
MLCIFNRPQLTAQVFDTILRILPEHLFIIADGPRLEHPEDQSLCTAARDVVSVVNWPYNVQYNFSAVNLGCPRRIVSGLNWAFEQVEEAIILEEDTLPDLSFFPYCEELLQRYRDDSQVMMISGYNGLGTWPTPDNAHYFFTRYGSIWGWATWRRAWQFYDFSLKRYQDWDIEVKLKKNLVNPEQIGHLSWRFNFLLRRSVNSWDMQWLLICVLHGGLCAIPRVNLVRNIGFGVTAIHTKNENDPRNLPNFSLPRLIVHPPNNPVDFIDEHYERWYYWLHLISRYENLAFLGTWGRALMRQPDLTLPVADNEAVFTLTPLHYPNETIEMLKYLQQFIPENLHLNQLISMFYFVSESRQENI